MTERLDHPTLYKEATGREMSSEDREELRSFLRLAPPALAQSATYVADIMIRQAQNRILCETISTAGDQILKQVQKRSDSVVNALVGETIERIHKSSPSAEAAANKAFLRGLWLFLAAFTLAALFLVTVVAWGWIRPQWFSQEYYAKIHFAEVVEEAVGGDVDWTRREDPFDESLVAVVDYAEARGTSADPYHRLSLHEACRAPGQIPYRSRGQDRCRYDLPRN